MPPRKKVAGTPRGIGLDLGFGDLFRGLGDFIDLLSEAVETTGESEVRKSGEFTVKGDDRLRGVYGFTIRTGLGGAPTVERFGNIRKTDEGMEVAEVREPLVDIFDEGQHLNIVIELPGTSEDEIQIELKDDILLVETTGQRKYAKEILLPEGAQYATASLQKTYRNGILELQIQKQAAN